jgi:hypothetical protein
VYDAAAGATSLQAISGLSSFTMAGGALDVTSGLTASQFTQTSGAITGAGAFTVNGSFSQSSGSIAMGGPVSITQSSGNLNVGSIRGTAINLTASNGAISQSAALSTTGLLSTQSTLGTVLNNTGNQINAFRSTSTGAGNIEIINTGLLDIQGITVANGNSVFNNTGGISTSGAVVASNGGVSITANSPLTVGTAGISATGNITLTATNLTSSGNLLLNGPISSSAGAVSMTAASSFTQNSAVTALMGVSASAGVAPMTFGASATTVGSPVSYTAAGISSTPPPNPLALPVDYMTSFLDQFAAALVAQDFIEVSPAKTGANVAAQPDTLADPLARYKKNKDDVVVEGQTCTR